MGILYPDDHPWDRGFCTGSLIAPHEFLTAGHCTIAASLDPARLSHLWVTFDQTVSVDPETGVISSEHPIAVTAATTYPDRSFEHNDVGVVHLDPAVDVGLTPVDLPPVGFLDQKRDAGELAGHIFTVSGYGLNGTDRHFFSPQANLIWDQQRESGPQEFQSLTQDRLHDIGASCGGDSGAPLFYDDDPNSAIVALGSSGPSTGAGPSNDQRLDTQSVQDFLARFTQ